MDAKPIPHPTPGNPNLNALNEDLFLWLNLGQQWLAKEPSASFPSSHASIAWAISAAAVWWVRHPLLIAGFLLSALLVAWSRVALGVHFPTDMAAGMVVGVLAA